MRNNLLYQGLVLFTALCAAACSGTVDDEYDQRELVLEADVKEIVADGRSVANFTVLYGDEDVTDEASVRCVTENYELEGMSFASEAVGSFLFKASYKKSESAEVTVKAGTRFKRRVCVMEFTGSWCSQCPAGAATLDFLVSRTYKGQAFAMAFHNEDEFSIPVEKEFKKLFNIDAYPAYVTDMREVGSLNGGGCSDSIETSLYESETHSSVSLTCGYDAASGKVSVDSKVFSEKDASYSLAAYIIEDMVKGEQIIGTGVDKDYTHRHVVRAMLSSSLRGDALGDIAAGKEMKKSYGFSVDKAWNAENLSVAVLVLDEKGEVNNMAVCQVDGDAMGYEYVN